MLYLTFGIDVDVDGIVTAFTEISDAKAFSFITVVLL